jgi:AraC-like DNA-binding protein
MALMYQIFGQLQQLQSQDTPTVPASIEPGIEMLHRSFRDPHLTVASLAKACFVSEVYFRRVYRACMGESPLQTILELRFRYARNLLRSGYYTPKQAAELSGFSDVKYFRVAFKKRYNETPSEYISRKTE